MAILLKSLQKHGFNAGALHGDMDQMSRTATLDAFREGRITLLAASDVAARGLDIPDVSHIFNFDVPWQSDDYVHRIGRTGRAGKEGRSLTLVTPEDIKQLKDIEKMLGARRHLDRRSAQRGGHGQNSRTPARPRRTRRETVGRRRPERGARRQAAAQRRPRPGTAREPSRKPDAASDQPAQRSWRTSVRAAIAQRHLGRQDHRDRNRPSSHLLHKPGPRTHVRRAASARRRRPERTEPAAPRPDRQPDRQNGKAKQPQQAKRQREPWEPREPRRQPDREDRGPTPVGLGDHVPAFLRKTTRSA